MPSGVYKRRPIKYRLRDTIDTSGGPDACWPCSIKSQTNKYGHKTIQYKGKMELVHRLIYRFKVEKIPKGICVLHSCDNPPCCNPKHLFLGTRTDNAKDRDKKGRCKRGEDNPAAKVTEHKVRRIRKFYSSGHWTINELANIYGVSFFTIKAIVCNDSWKHVK